MAAIDVSRRRARCRPRGPSQGASTDRSIGVSLLGAYQLRARVSPARAAAAGALLAAACLFKQTQAVSLVVVGAWLPVYHRGARRAYATAAGAVSALGTAIVLSTFRRGAWLHLVVWTPTTGAMHQRLCR